MPHVGFPITIGGSLITDKRVDGPPSKKLPILRDLAASAAVVTVEIDTDHDRHVGQIEQIIEAKPGPRTPERLVLVTEIPTHMRAGHQVRPHNRRKEIKTPDILAFRVISIDADLDESHKVIV